MDLPQEFIHRMKERLGEKFPAFLASYEVPPCKGLRVNTLKITAEAFEGISPFALERVPWEKNGFYLTEEKPGADVYHFAGLYYMQEPSAMCAVPMLGVEPGERVLDLCAAPGGKTTQLAAAMQGEGVLIANEPELSRAKILSQNVERLGVKNCAVLRALPAELSPQFPAYFDKILVDAPCSGEGMFKKEPNAVPEWSAENVVRCAARQREILDEAAKMLRGGGRMVYSTCTFAEEEDERQIEAFLKRHSEFELLEMKKLLPHEQKGEGHFAALLYKKEGEEGRAKPYPVKRSRAANEAFAAFAEDFFEGDPVLSFRPTPQGAHERLREVPQRSEVEKSLTTLSDGRMYLVPAGMPALSVYTLRLGVFLGEWDGKLFKPAHALAMALGDLAKRKVALSREEAKRYLHGETVETSLDNGWAAVCVDGFPLGLGKIVNGTVKNHLPKGLRMIK